MPGSHSIGTKINVKKFAREYVRNGGNGTKAVQAIKPIKYDSARTRAKDLMKRDDVRAEIELALQENQINYDFILSTRKRIIAAGAERIQDMKITPNDLHIHLQGLEKIMERLDKKPDAKRSSLHLHVDNLSYTDAIKERESYSRMFGDIIDGEAVQADNALEEDKK